MIATNNLSTKRIIRSDIVSICSICSRVKTINKNNQTIWASPIIFIRKLKKAMNNTKNVKIIIKQKGHYWLLTFIDTDGLQKPIETYIKRLLVATNNREIIFSHGYCTDCYKREEEEALALAKMLK